MSATLSVQNVTLYHIGRLVARLRDDGQQGSFCLGTDETPFSGKQCHIFVVDFPDTTQWAIRVPFHARNLDSDSLTSAVETEVDKLRTISDIGFKWSPRLIASDSGFENILSFPYIVLEWIPGRPLQWTATVPARKYRNKVIDQIVTATLDLASATIFGEISIARFSQPLSSRIELERNKTGYEHLIEMTDRQIRRVVNGQLPGITAQDCSLHRILARKAVDPIIDTVDFIIQHSDLSVHNIIVDESTT